VPESFRNSSDSLPFSPVSSNGKRRDVTMMSRGQTGRAQQALLDTYTYMYISKKKKERNKKEKYTKQVCKSAGRNCEVCHVAKRGSNRDLPQDSRFSKGTNRSTRQGASFLILMFQVNPDCSVSLHHLTQNTTTTNDPGGRRNGKRGREREREREGGEKKKRRGKGGEGGEGGFVPDPGYSRAREAAQSFGRVFG